MAHSGLDAVELVVRTIAQTAVDNETYFCELDAVVGDGDFGYSLARGFEKLLADWDTLDRSSMGKFLKKVSSTVSGRIGGTSGPIWGTAFLRAGVTIGDKTTIDGSDVVAMLRAAAAGIQQRGQAELGDKTLLDALVPATDRLEQAVQAGDDAPTTIRAMAETARACAEAMRALVAKRGRAAYSGDRSIGSLDAGAVAVAVMLEQISLAWEEA
jgi:phosphoenolpyruvate---glycerone phosphotransferase subunit DhaL